MTTPRTKALQAGINLDSITARRQATERELSWQGYSKLCSLGLPFGVGLVLFSNTTFKTPSYKAMTTDGYLVREFHTTESLEVGNNAQEYAMRLYSGERRPTLKRPDTHYTLGQIRSTHKNCSVIVCAYDNGKVTVKMSADNLDITHTLTDADHYSHHHAVMRAATK